MQCWLTDLPAIQAGMLVVYVVTFHSTGSEVRWRPAAAATAPVSGNFTVKATLIYNGDLSKQKKWNSAADCSNGNVTLS